MGQAHRHKFDSLPNCVYDNIIKRRRETQGEPGLGRFFFNKIYYSNSLSHIKTASQDYNLKIFAYVRQIKNAIFVFND